VTRDRGSADLEPADDLSGRQLVTLEILEDLSSGWIGQSLENPGLDGSIIAYIPILAH
jgi:hypothetical protein